MLQEKNAQISLEQAFNVEEIFWQQKSGIVMVTEIQPIFIG